MKRIVIIGCPGSGKTRMARALGEKLDLSVVHLDRLWWKQGWENVSREEFDARLERAMALDSWIIDGNYNRTMDARLTACDTIIYLDYNRWECLWGMCQRLLASRKKRADLPDGCPERFNWEFAKTIWRFNENNRVINYTRIAKYKHAKAIVLKSRKEARVFLESI
jgi:adenylate kinase family enzyme